jgi:hypothetical protein
MLTPQISSASVAEPLTHADLFAGLGVFSLAARELSIKSDTKCSDKSTYAVVLGQVFPSLRPSPTSLSYADCANKMNFVASYYAIASPESQFTPT